MRCFFQTNEVLKAAGLPAYIRGAEFNTNQALRQFTVLDTPVTVSTQHDYIDDMLKQDGGWVTFASGIPEMTKLFANSMLAHYSKSTNSLLWHHVTSSKWDKLCDSREKTYPHMIVLDSLLTHPPMHPNAFRAYDPTRIGKIYDIVSMYRGKSSIIILCPSIEPFEAFKCSNIQPEFMLYLQPKVKYVQY